MLNYLEWGTLSRQGLENILKKIDFNKIKNLNINGYATCTSISEIRVKYFKFNGKDECGLFWEKERIYLGERKRQSQSI